VRVTERLKKSGFVLKTKMMTEILLKIRGVAEGTQTVKMKNLHWAGTIVAMKAEKGTAESPKPAQKILHFHCLSAFCHSSYL